MQFDAPATGGGSLKPAEVEGHLLVVEPTEYVPSIATSFGEKDAIRVTVHDITEGETHDNVLLFGTALIGSLKTQVGKRGAALHPGIECLNDPLHTFHPFLDQHR